MTRETKICKNKQTNKKTIKSNVATYKKDYVS